MPDYKAVRSEVEFWYYLELQAKSRAKVVRLFKYANKEVAHFKAIFQILLKFYDHLNR